MNLDISRPIAGLHRTPGVPASGKGMLHASPAPMGLSRVIWVPPIAGWFMRETPIYKWMMNRGTPISGNHHEQHILANTCEFQRKKRDLRS